MSQSYGVDKKGRAGDVVEVVATGGAPVVLGAGRTVHHRGDRMVIKLAHCKGHWGISRWVRQFNRSIGYHGIHQLSPMFSLLVSVSGGGEGNMHRMSGREQERLTVLNSRPIVDKLC